MSAVAAVAAANEAEQQKQQPLQSTQKRQSVGGEKQELTSQTWHLGQEGGRTNEV